MIAVAVVATVALVWLCFTLWIWSGGQADLVESMFTGAVATVVLAVIASGAYAVWLLWQEAL